ncbi:N-acetyltransferase family protein [Oxalobacteraceae bacterium CAVE-383]|nr:N-acetyltransferase family protein [Oxalobacteraceae bacterium CAVE-383]
MRRYSDFRNARLGDYVHRDATAEDLAAIVAIYNATVASRQVTADTEPVTVASRRDWFERHTPQRRPLWVAERGGEVIGWLSYSDFYGRPAYAATAELSIYIHPAARGQGLGRYFMTEALLNAADYGIDTLLGFIFGHNLPSLALFEAFGFERWGNLPGVARLDGTRRDLVIMGRGVASDESAE